VKPDLRFLKMPKSFWAHVRTIGQTVGYTERGRGRIKIPSIEEIKDAYSSLHLATDWLSDPRHPHHDDAVRLIEYLDYRSKVLNGTVETLLMDAKAAEQLFKSERKRLSSRLTAPMNKQKGAKKKPAFLTGLVNMIIDSNRKGREVDYDPRSLTTVVRDGVPLRTLARRVDGAFPSVVNPVAVWEIKEYYYTTTFGSRVADGVYETLLDGMELEELEVAEGIKILHYLFVDSHYTWWECGRSYLCRIIDMLHMGYVDEVMFGREIITELPKAVKHWGSLVKS